MKECLECGKPLQGMSPLAKYCSKNCAQKVWRRNNRSKVKKYQEEGAEDRRDWNYRNKYGITVEDYNQMFADQNGCCDICGVHQSEVDKRFAVDHNHDTGEVRGLLCSNCNRALGLFGDNTENLAKAIIYLQERSYEQ